MRRVVLALAGTGLGLALLVDPSAAAKPNNRACLGIDASAAARALRPYGNIISDIATSAPHAIGEEVQLHLAGEVPDSVFPNTCNDE